MFLLMGEDFFPTVKQRAFNQEFSIVLRLEETRVCKHWRTIHVYESSNGLGDVQKMISSLKEKKNPLMLLV